MGFGKQIAGVGAAALAMALTGAGIVVQAQDTTTAAASQQNVPDAPRPQTLPQLKTITPVGPALPDAPPPANTGAPAKDDQLAPPSSLPSTPKADTAAAQDDGPAPELPGAGQGAAAFHLAAVHVNFVQIPFTVKTSKGALVPGLTWRDVRVSENGIRQNLAIFSTDPMPLSVALVIDQSVDYHTMNKINNSLDALQGAFAPYDEVEYFTYNNGVRNQTNGFLGGQTARLGAILDRSKAPGREPDMTMGGPLDQTQIKNNEIVDPNTTAVRNQQGITIYAKKEFHTLNDAILAAAESLNKTAPGRLRIVYVISDGKEYGSKATQKEVIRYCQTNRITVYATVVSEEALPGVGFLDRIHLPLTMRDNALHTYTEATGSGTPDYELYQNGIEKSFQRIAVQARNQYTIGYYSHESVLDEKYRSVNVEILQPNLLVIAPRGYYPTPTRTAVPPPVTPTATP
jgi:VWFA-related protein